MSFSLTPKQWFSVAHTFKQTYKINLVHTKELNAEEFVENET